MRLTKKDWREIWKDLDYFAPWLQEDIEKIVNAAIKRKQKNRCEHGVWIADLCYGCDDIERKRGKK